MVKSLLFIDGLAAAALMLAGCTSVDTKFGKFNKPRAQFEPTAVARACSADNECVKVDYTCDACCPGGASVNRKYMDIFKRNQTEACASTPRRPAACANALCVMAPAHCLEGLCTWDYRGPDPSSL